MTKEEFKVRYDKYVKKAEYYRRKADRLEEEFSYQMNKEGIMNTKFDIGEMVYIKAVIENIRIDREGNRKYSMWIDKMHTALSMPEDFLTKIDDEPIELKPMSKELQEHYERLAEHYNRAVRNE